MEAPSRKIGVFGGSFDPPHLGHFICARIAAETLGLARVLVIPAANPPHKQQQLAAPPEARWEMVCAAVADDPLFQPSRIELDRGGVSYTVDTLEALQQEYPAPENRLFFIVGDDSFAELGSWREPERILKLAQVVIMNRWDSDTAAITPSWQAQIIHVNTPRIEITSTLIRRRIAAGLAIRDMVNCKVEAIIRKLKLFKQ